MTHIQRDHFHINSKHGLFSHWRIHNQKLTRNWSNAMKPRYFILQCPASDHLLSVELWLNVSPGAKIRFVKRAI